VPCKQHSDPVSTFSHTLTQIEIAIFKMALFVIFIVALYAFLKHEVHVILQLDEHAISRPVGSTSDPEHIAARSP
jgi:hypothetical protein